jgi:hypothetical protein
MKMKPAPKLLEGEDLRNAIRAVLGTIQRICCYFLWWRHILPRLLDLKESNLLEHDPLEDDRRLAFEATEGAVLEATFMNLRAFDDFCDSENKRHRRLRTDDLILANFGWDLGGAFLDPEERMKVDKLIAHLTHTFLASTKVDFNYQKMLSAAIRKAKRFCQYAESDVGAADPALLKHVRRVFGLLESVEKVYGKQPNSSVAHA